jgi:hypothetical protein
VRANQTQRPQAWREAVEVIAMDGFTGFKTAAAEETPTRDRRIQTRLHPALVKSRSSWGSAKDTTETGNQ